MGEQLTPLRWLTTWCSPSLRPWLLGNNAHTHWPTPCRAAPLEPRGYPATSTSQKSVDEKYADVLACPEHVVRAGGKDYAAFFAHPPRGFFYCLLELKTDGEGTRKESFGVVALVPGATLHFEAHGSTLPFVASLAYLTSYRGM